MANNSFSGEISFELVSLVLYDPFFACSVVNSGFCNPYSSLDVSNTTQCDLNKLPGISQLNTVCSNQAHEFVGDYEIIQKLAPGADLSKITWDVSGRASSLLLDDYPLNSSSFDLIDELNYMRDL